MENQNEQNTQTKPQTPTVGGVGRSALASAVLGALGREPAEKDNKGTEASAGTPPGGATVDILAGTDDSTTLEGGAGGGEIEPETVDVWEFNGVEYTADQVEESLRERESYQRYNQSVQPLVDAINQSEAATARYKAMAQTETEKQIEYLEAQIASGRLAPHDKAMAYDQLREAKKRQEILVEAAEKSAEYQRNSMDKIRRQRASQTVNTLTRQKWSADEIRAVAAGLERVVGDKIGDVISPELMQVFRDADELRRLRSDNAKRLGKKANETASALKTPKQPLTKPAPKAQGSKSFGAKVWGDKYK